jgi:hypothetical protein
MVSRRGGECRWEKSRKRKSFGVIVVCTENDVRRSRADGERENRWFWSCRLRYLVQLSRSIGAISNANEKCRIYILKLLEDSHLQLFIIIGTMKESSRRFAITNSLVTDHI